MDTFKAKEWYVDKFDGRIKHISHKPTKKDFLLIRNKVKQMFEFLERLYNI